jgi:formylglycine-generating enzyme required for sulfatase activity
MVQIPAGHFLMGAPKDELEQYSDEIPQHEVTLKSFFIGMYPITQNQWKVVAALPQLNQKLDPDCSNFKGDDLPVEQVSWDEATEFCDRLTVKTNRHYRLPTEAEWEYACRAGTTTPFHFGETLTTEIANHDGNYPYGRGTKGVYRQKTTPVGSFPANPWGLYDMHGNVREWCLDPWHDSYTEKPEHLKENGNIPWTTENPRTTQLLRGGSWYDHTRFCRSDSRYDINPDLRNNAFGFRVVCSGARTLR